MAKANTTSLIRQHQNCRAGFGVPPLGGAVTAPKLNRLKAKLQTQSHGN
jgi:hypothetical protein